MKSKILKLKALLLIYKEATENVAFFTVLASCIIFLVGSAFFSEIPFVDIALAVLAAVMLISFIAFSFIRSVKEYPFGVSLDNSILRILIASRRFWSAIILIILLVAAFFGTYFIPGWLVLILVYILYILSQMFIVDKLHDFFDRYIKK